MSNAQNLALSNTGLICHENSHQIRTNTDAASSMKWTLTHGLYATMGGFTSDGSTVETPFLPKGHDYLTITTAGVEVFLKLGYTDEFSNVSAEDIRDKGKSSLIAKFLVLMQALRFCAQLIARLAQSLPISLLELNTFVHGICTVFAIYFWWEKPQDVEQPTILPLNRIQPLCTFLWMHSKVSKKRYDYTEQEREVFINRNPYGSVEGDSWISVVTTGRDDCSGEEERGRSAAARSTLVSQLNSDSSNATGNSSSTSGPHTLEMVAREQNMLHAHSELPSTPSRLQDCENSSALLDKRRTSLPSPPSLDCLQVKKGYVVPSTIFSLRDSWEEPDSVIVRPILMTRLSLASKLSELHPDFFAKPGEFGGKSNCLAPRVVELALTTYFVGLLAIFISAMIYGGLHCLAWNSQSFATSTERLLWRIFCLVLILPVPLGIIGLFTLGSLVILCVKVKELLLNDGSYVENPCAGRAESLLPTFGVYFLVIILWGIAPAISLAFILGRVYLLH